MRLAVLSDIHSNLTAFHAVLRDMSQNRVNKAVSLGDNIGYGSEPEPVIEILKRYKIPSVLGNHEMAFLDEAYLKTFNPAAKKALQINKKKLSDDAGRYISDLPICLVQFGCRFVHGAPPDSIAAYIFNEPEESLARIMAQLRERLTFVGHTHQLGLYELDEGCLYKRPLVKPAVCLAKSGRYIINTGSVGQPRDGNPNAKYVIWDSKQNIVEPRWVPYDIRAAAEKIKKAGIPGLFADLLINAQM